MSGLNLQLGVGGNASAASAAAPPPQTAGQAAFGSAYTAAGEPSARGSLMPNDPFGVALWVGVGALALLLFVRYSLPA